MLPTLVFLLLMALAVLAAPILFILNDDDLAPWLAPFRPIRRLVGLPTRPLKVAPRSGGNVCL